MRKLVILLLDVWTKPLSQSDVMLENMQLLEKLIVYSVTKDFIAQM